MQLNDLFAAELDQHGIHYTREYKCIPGRRLAYDFFITVKNKRPLYLLIELQGGTWMKRSGHNSGQGIQRDCEKLNLATLEGYACMHFTTDDVTEGVALEMVMRYLGGI